MNFLDFDPIVKRNSPNLTKVPYNTWWIDSGCTIHVFNTMQELFMTRTTNPSERFIFMENRVKFPVEAVGTYRLTLDIGHHLDLSYTFYVPSISRNLIFLFKLNTSGYYFKYGNECFSLFKQNIFIGSSILCDGLYKLKLDNFFAESLLTLELNVVKLMNCLLTCGINVWVTYPKK